MTWIDFLLYLALIYVVYYAFNLMFDILRKPRLEGVQEGDTYTFQTDLTEFDESPTVIEDDEPVAAKIEAIAAQSAPTLTPPIQSAPTEEWVNSEEDSEEIEFEVAESNPVRSTGGVTNINSLFVLAKEGTIEMKKKVVFS